MLEINLLPWREHKKLYEKKRMAYIMSAAIILPFGFIFSTHVFLTHKLNTVANQIEKLSHTLKQIESSNKIAYSEKNNELALNKMMNKFTLRQAQTIRLFNDLGVYYHQSLCFTKIQREKRTFLFTGYTRSIVDLKDFLLHWKASHLLGEIKLEQIRYKNNDSTYFVLKASAFK